jgi:hypothetical protein
VFLATPRAHADTFNIEIDWMEEVGENAHSHRPTDAEIAAVVQMFACQGHVLNIERSNVVTHYPVLVPDPFNQVNYFQYSGVAWSFGAIKAANFNHSGQPGWHYCLFAHEYGPNISTPSGSSGLGELCGDDFMVTLASFSGRIGTPFDKAATLAHEFGHNLCLNHCASGLDCGETGNYQENMPSVMSYFYQLSGVRRNLACQKLAPQWLNLFKEIDYSHGTMCNLYEFSLDEEFGTGMNSVDWNCNGTIAGVVAQDLNGSWFGWCGASGNQGVLWDFDEWSNINDVTFTMSPDELKRRPAVSCITARELEDHLAKMGDCGQPALSTEGCVTARPIYCNPFATLPPDGSCGLAYKFVRDAVNAAPSGSVLFLRAETYSEAPGTITIDRPMTILCTGQSNGPSSAVIE